MGFESELVASPRLLAPLRLGSRRCCQSEFTCCLTLPQEFHSLTIRSRDLCSLLTSHHENDGPLGRGATGHGVEGRFKDNLEAVSLCSQFPSAAVANGFAQEHSLRGERVRVLISEPGRQSGRTLNVAEEQRHRVFAKFGRDICHVVEGSSFTTWRTDVQCGPGSRC